MLLLLSIVILVMISDLLHPITSCTSSVGDKWRKSLYLWLISIFVSGISLAAFCLCQSRNKRELVTMGMFISGYIIVNSLFIVLQCVLIRMSSTVKIIDSELMDTVTDTALVHEISSVENEGLSGAEFIDENTTLLLPEEGQDDRGIEREEMTCIEKELPGNTELASENTPLFNDTRVQGNALHDPEHNKSFASVRDVALNTLTETISKENVNAPFKAESKC